MTDRLELIHELIAKGVTISPAGGSLLVKPTERLTPEIIDRIRNMKPELIAILTGQTDPCQHCGGSVVRDRTFDGFWNRVCASCGKWHWRLDQDGN